ncbi:hypothetical protein [Kitasatospora herbaricolor]|uniref:Uncharacterized protein n=1 Tax=Kitasatospora herbaricolor TaxID=68217 RepID=A0ABZ1WH82_9ACTN|nr:hypothetical protein [Kitasatospora herbaricolor]
MGDTVADPFFLGISCFDCRMHGHFPGAPTGIRFAEEATAVHRIVSGAGAFSDFHRPAAGGLPP